MSLFSSHHGWAVPNQNGLSVQRWLALFLKCKLAPAPYLVSFVNS